MEQVRKKPVYISTAQGEISLAPIVLEAKIIEAVTEVIKNVDLGRTIDPRMVRTRLFNEPYEIDCPLSVLVPIIASLRAYVFARLLDGHFAVFFERRNS